MLSQKLFYFGAQYNVHATTVGNIDCITKKIFAAAWTLYGLHEIHLIAYRINTSLLGNTPGLVLILNF